MIILAYSLKNSSFQSVNDYQSDSVAIQMKEDEQIDNDTIKGSDTTKEKKKQGKQSLSDDEKKRFQTKSQKKENKKQYAFLTINFRNLTKADNYKKLAANLRRYVPENGYLLKKEKIEYSQGDSAFDIFKKGIKKYNIPMEYQGANQTIYNSVYIQGINHIYEFSAGPESGWMYSVNGEFLNYGISVAKVKENDEISLVYTTNLGCDVGSSMKQC